MRKQKIVVVEDDQRLALALSIRLEEAGYEVLFANDSTMGVNGILCDTDKPDLVLMDIQLPGESGLWAAERLQMLEETSHIPVVFLTGNHQPGVRERAEELGAGFFEKPYDAEELLAHIAEVLRERRLPTLRTSEIMQELEKIQWLSPEAEAGRTLAPLHT